MASNQQCCAGTPVAELSRGHAGRHFPQTACAFHCSVLHGNAARQLYVSVHPPPTTAVAVTSRGSGTYGYFQHKSLWSGQSIVATVVVVVVVLVLVPTAVIAGNVVLVVLVVVGVVVLAVVVVMAVGEVDYNTQLPLLRRFFVVISYGDWPTDPMEAG